MLPFALRNGRIFLIVFYINEFGLYGGLCFIDSGSCIILWKILDLFKFRLKVGSGLNIPAALEAGRGLLCTRVAPR